jgi:hypothetical protein
LTDDEGKTEDVSETLATAEVRIQPVFSVPRILTLCSTL